MRRDAFGALAAFFAAVAGFAGFAVVFVIVAKINLSGDALREA